MESVTLIKLFTLKQKKIILKNKMILALLTLTNINRDLHHHHGYYHHHFRDRHDDYHNAL
jgi:hypothetical protein